MRLLNRSADCALFVLFAAMLILVNAQIVCRFVLAVGVPWTEEVSRLVFVWLAYLGAAVGLREGGMIVIDTLPEMLGEHGRRVLAVPAGVISLAVIVFLFAASIPLVLSVWPTTLATVDWISNGWVYLAFTVSFALMIIYSTAPILARLLAPGREHPL